MRSQMEYRVRLHLLECGDHGAEVVEVDLMDRDLPLQRVEIVLRSAVPAREAVHAHLGMVLDDVLGEVAPSGTADSRDERAAELAQALTLFSSAHSSRIRS